MSLNDVQLVCLPVSERISTLLLQMGTEDIYALGDCAGYHPKTGKSVLPALAQVRFMWPLFKPVTTIKVFEISYTDVRFIPRATSIDLPDCRLPVPFPRPDFDLPINWKSRVRNSAPGISLLWASFLNGLCLCMFWLRRLGPRGATINTPCRSARLACPI
jgi:hypothetical protein